MKRLPDSSSVQVKITHDPKQARPYLARKFIEEPDQSTDQPTVCWKLSKPPEAFRRFASVHMSGTKRRRMCSTKILKTKWPCKLMRSLQGLTTPPLRDWNGCCHSTMCARTHRIRRGDNSKEKNMPKKINHVNPDFSREHRKIDARLLLPEPDWDIQTAQKLLDTKQVLNRLADLLTAAKIKTTPPDLAPWMMQKAVDANRFGGFTVHLLAPYKTSPDLQPEYPASKRDKLIHNHYQVLIDLPNQVGNKSKSTIDLLEFYAQLTKTDAAIQPGYRQSPGINPNDLLPPPPAPLDIPDLLGSLNMYITQSKIADPLIKIALVFAQASWMQPFERENFRFSLTLLDHLIVRWTPLHIPAYNFTRWLFEHRFEYFQHLRAYFLSADVTGWLNFFLDELQACLEDSTKTFNAYLQLEEQLSTHLSTDLFSGDQSTEITAILLRQPVFTQWYLARELRSEMDAETIIAELLKGGIVHQVTESGGHPLLVCDQVLDFWKQSENRESANPQVD